MYIYIIYIINIHKKYLGNHAFENLSKTRFSKDLTHFSPQKHPYSK